MARSRAKSELLTGFLLSLVLHGTVMVGMMRAEVPGSMMANLLPNLPDPSWEPPSVPLGLDESIAETETWIGFEEYQEQRAAPSEVEQGAFTTRPGSLEPQEAPGALLAEAAALETSAPTGAQPSEAPEAPLHPVELQEEVEAWLAALPPDPGPVQAPPADEATAAETVDTPQDQPQTPAPPATSSPAEPQPVPVEPVPVTEPAPAPGGEPGQPADQESDPAAINVTMDQLTLGKPLAARGLQIKPKKPVFTTLMMLTSAPGNPSAELRFRRNGEPVRVRLLESSGDPRIDEAVLNSLYKWRAAGKKLGELKEGQTFPVTIKILMR